MPIQHIDAFLPLTAQWSEAVPEHLDQTHVTIT